MSGIVFTEPSGRKISDGTDPGAVGNFLFGPGTPRTDDRIKLASQRYREIAFSELDDRLGYYDQRLRLHFAPVLFDPLLGDSGASGVELFAVTGDRILFLAPAPPVATPAEVEAEEQRLNGDYQADRAAFLGRQPKRELTLSDLAGSELPTVREAASLIVGLQGELRERDGRLVVRLPETLASPGWNAGYDELAQRAQVRDALRVLVAARDVVLDELARSGKRFDPARLPDRQAAADGGVTA